MNNDNISLLTRQIPLSETRYQSTYLRVFLVINISTCNMPALVAGMVTSALAQR